MGLGTTEVRGQGAQRTGPKGLLKGKELCPVREGHSGDLNPVLTLIPLPPPRRPLPQARAGGGALGDSGQCVCARGLRVRWAVCTGLRPRVSVCTCACACGGVCICGCTRACACACVCRLCRVSSPWTLAQRTHLCCGVACGSRRTRRGLCTAPAPQPSSWPPSWHTWPCHI